MLKYYNKNLKLVNKIIEIIEDKRIFFEKNLVLKDRNMRNLQNAGLEKS